MSPSPARNHKLSVLTSKVEDLDGGEADADVAAEQLITELGRFPAFAMVHQDGQAGDLAAVAVVESVVV